MWILLLMLAFPLPAVAMDKGDAAQGGALGTASVISIFALRRAARQRKAHRVAKEMADRFKWDEARTKSEARALHKHGRSYGRRIM